MEHVIRYRLNIQHPPTSYAVVFLYVCAFEFYRIFERIGHLLDLLIFAAFIAAFSIGPFGLGLALWQDPFLAFGQRIVAWDCILRNVCADCIVRTASWRAVSCGLHRGADCIVRISFAFHRAHSTVRIPSCW